MTNTDSKDPESISHLLSDKGFSIKAKEIYNPLRLIPIIINFESQGTKSEILSEIPSLNPQKSEKSGLAVLSSSFTRLTASSMIRSAIS